MKYLETCFFKYFIVKFESKENNYEIYKKSKIR